MSYTLKAFGVTHLFSIIVAIAIGFLFIFLAKKYPNKEKLISYLLVFTIIMIRSTRYFFDINLGLFQITDLISLHICHIDLIILVIALLMKKEKLFVFNFLIGIPTALAVALFPGVNHPDPGLLRAIFFIMSHTMLVMGTIYMISVYNFKISKKDIKFYYLFSLVGMVIAYIYNYLTNSNFMYLMTAPKKTVLESLYNMFGSFGYLISIYLILITLITIVYFIYRIFRGEK